MFLSRLATKNDEGGSSAAEIRSLAFRLLKVADRLDRVEFGGQEPLLAFYSGEDEKTLILALQEYKGRRKRSEFIPADLLAEPAWDILLDLFIQQAQGRKITISDACRASDVPDTTALRWLAALSARGLVDRMPSDHDKRIQFVSLSEAGSMAIRNWLGYRGALPV